MSRDARYLLHYEPQPYANNFPASEIDELNNHPDIHWFDKLAPVSPYDYMGECKHSHLDLIKELSKADQILVSYDGQEWEVSPVGDSE